MRKVDRIDRILALLLAVWHECPDFRFGQLVVNIDSTGSHDNNLFYTEDDRFEESLRSFAISMGVGENID